MDAVNPNIAIIGVSANNKFGHPNSIVLERLEKRKIQIYRTDQMGEISIKVKNTSQFYIKSKICIDLQN